jgi:quinoprotein glucose dehydrogenase
MNTLRSISWLALVCMIAACSGKHPDTLATEVEQLRSTATSAEHEWRVYLGDQASGQYSPLKKIHRGNVHRLQLAWQYDASDGDPDLQGESQHNPLVIKGILYGTAAHASRLFALNAATGEELWAWEPPETSGQVNRGLLYWSDEAGKDERILFGSGQYIYAIDAVRGQPIAEFGNDGAIDLREALTGDDRDFDFVAATTPGVIHRDMLIQGMRVNEFSGAAPGHIRAYDVRTGAIRWHFNTIPAPGEFGADTWPDGAYQQAGGANSWAGMALDEERGLAFIPTGSATMDTFGADRAGDNLFANTLLALDANTGERRWHYQVVRHDLWDRDLPTPPNLVTIELDGVKIDAVAQATKSGHVFIFNRETGEPLFPIKEEPVHGVALPGEAPARSQPIPVLPQAFTAQGLDAQGLDDRSMIVQQESEEKLSTYQHQGIYNLPSLDGSVLRPGFDGGAEWGGAAWDPERHLLYINANETASVLQMVPTEGTSLTDFTDVEIVYRMACGQCHGNDRRGGGIAPSLRDVGSRIPPWQIYDIILNGRGRMPAIDARMGRLGALAIMWYLYTAGDSEPSERAVGMESYIHAGYPDFIASDGLPATRPPWGSLNAIDLTSGKIQWKIPLGDFPQALGMGLTGKGATNYGGPVATAGGLVFIAATPDAMFRAFDSDTGELLWETQLPSGGFATPATYEAGGQQYVVINASGTKLGTPPGRYYLAFKLPKIPLGED